MSDDKCLFCGGDTDFLATIPGKVCLGCGDKLQSLGVMLMSMEQYRAHRPPTYLAVPYTTDDTRLLWERYRAANQATAYLLREGHHVISPISHCHQIILDHELPKGWDFWEKYDRALLMCCNLLIVLKLPGWKESVGVQAEIKIAGEMGIRIEYLEPEEIGLNVESTASER